MRLGRVIRQRLRSIFRHSQVENDLQRGTRGPPGATHERIQSGRNGRARRHGGGAPRVRRHCHHGRAVPRYAPCSFPGRHRQRSRLRLEAAREIPGFSATAVLSLALGVGANTAIFGLVKQVILDLLPVRDPDRIVAISKNVASISRTDQFVLEPVPARSSGVRRHAV